MATLPSDPSPDVNIDASFKPRMKIAEFGDGYSQRAPFGINGVALEIKLVWSTLTIAEKNTVMAFIEDHSAGEAFTFTLPDEDTARQWYFVDWGKTYVRYGVYNVRASLKEDFGL